MKLKSFSYIFCFIVTEALGWLAWPRTLVVTSHLTVGGLCIPLLLPAGHGPLTCKGNLPETAVNGGILAGEIK